MPYLEGLANGLALHEQIDALLSDDPRQRLVLLIDQFEETFTQTKDEAVGKDAAAVTAVIETLAHDGARLLTPSGGHSHDDETGAPAL